MLGSAPLFGKTWYVRPAGGTRYSSKVTSGQCDGRTDALYSGKGVNPHCAYCDFRYLWDDDSRGVGRGAWVFAGGDTVIVRGCKALPSQQHPSNPNWRVGWDMPTENALNRWTFINNLTVGNCNRMSQPPPGAPPTYNKYLTGFCRAAGNVFAFVTAKNSHLLIANNTVVAYSATIFDLACQPVNSCGSTSFAFTNNIFLGYSLKAAEAPGLFYIEDRSIKLTTSHNIEFGNRPGTGTSCRGDIICADPRLVNQPPQQRWTKMSFLDNFDFHPASGSPENGHGIP